MGIMVALNNIFIGIMSNTYDAYQEKALRLFARNRAIVAADYALFRESFAQEHFSCFLWLCTPIVKEQQHDFQEEHTSLRIFMERGFDEAGKNSKRAEERMRRLQAAVGSLGEAKKAPAMDAEPTDSVCKTSSQPLYAYPTLRKCAT